MAFLCMNHRKRLESMTEDQLSQQWCEWMNHAAVNYKKASWKKALAFSGSSLDLARMCVNNNDNSYQERMLHCYCLSTVYSAHLCQRTGQMQRANQLLDTACQQLYTLLCSEKSHCIEKDFRHFTEILLNPDLHQCYLSQFTRLPYEPMAVVQPKKALH